MSYDVGLESTKDELKMLASGLQLRVFNDVHVCLTLIKTST